MFYPYQLPQGADPLMRPQQLQPLDPTQLLYQQQLMSLAGACVCVWGVHGGEGGGELC